MLLALGPILKVAIYIVAAISVLILTDIWITGRGIKHISETESPDKPSTVMMLDGYRKKHRWRTNAIIATTITTIVLVAIARHLVFHLVDYPPFFRYHMAVFVAPFCVLFGIQRILRKNANIHAKLGRWCVVWGILTNISGVYLTVIAFPGK